MSLDEAEELRQTIQEAASHKEPIIKRLAGDEHVIYLKKTKEYIWSVDDWHKIHLWVKAPVAEEVEA